MRHTAKNRPVLYRIVYKSTGKPHLFSTHIGERQWFTYGYILDAAQGLHLDRYAIRIERNQ